MGGYNNNNYIIVTEAKTIVLLSWVYSWPRQLECQLVEKMGFIVWSWALELDLSWAWNETQLPSALIGI
jgi:hypothetical protein